MKRLVTDHHRLGIPLMYNVAQLQPPYLELALYTEWKRHTKQNRHIRSHNVYSVGRNNILGGPAETSFSRFRSRIRFLLWQRMGLEIALELITEEKKIAAEKPFIYRDNQAAIRSSEQPETTIRPICVSCDSGTHRNLHSQLEIHWIPANSGVPGNKATCLVAKVATGWRKKESRVLQSPNRPQLDNFTPYPLYTNQPYETELGRSRYKIRKRWKSRAHHIQMYHCARCILGVSNC